MSYFASGRVVVGIDSPYRSQPAIEMAVAEARRLGAGVTVVHVFVEPVAYGIGFWAPGLAEVVEESRTALSHFATQISTDHPDVDIQSTVIVGSAALTLINLSDQARLIVLDCRGQGGFAELMLGSVSSQVAAHARCPVLVRRPSDAQVEDAAKPIFVGVDGSPVSEAAVGWAFAEAESRSTRLVGLHCWPASSAYSVDEAIRDAEQRRQEQEAQLLVSEALAGWREKHPDVVVEERIMAVDEVQAGMVEASREATLMVVGSRGRGGYLGLALGSVSQALLHHSHCPVLVTRP